MYGPSGVFGIRPRVRECLMGGLMTIHPLIRTIVLSNRKRLFVRPGSACWPHAGSNAATSCGFCTPVAARSSPVCRDCPCRWEFRGGFGEESCFVARSGCAPGIGRIPSTVCCSLPRPVIITTGLSGILWSRTTSASTSRPFASRSPQSSRTAVRRERRRYKPRAPGDPPRRSETPCATQILLDDRLPHAYRSPRCRSVSNALPNASPDACQRGMPL